MKVVESEQIWVCDIDDTVILWDIEQFKTTELIHITCPYDGKQYAVKPHEGNIQLVKEKRARGCFVMLWSQGGYQWARTVAEALGLEVDLILSKPIGVIDDLEPVEWMPSPTYIPVDAKWKATGKATTNNKGSKHE